MIFKEAILDNDQILIDGNLFSVIKGKHCIWVPDFNGGAKIIWSHNGKIEAYRDWEKGKNKNKILNGTFNDKSNGWDLESLRSIAAEYLMMTTNANRKFSPPVSGMFFIENFITSKFPYNAPHCDCIGKFGYFIKDANKCSEGNFDLDVFLNENKDILDFSKGAIGDLKKHDNTINGYLVDIRRTIWDTIKYKDMSVVDSNIWMPEFNTDELKDNISKLTQFPHKERKQNYQTYILDDEYQKGSRDTQYRFDEMGIKNNLNNKTVLDLGCNLGAVCLESFNRGARKITGIDYEKDYIKCARNLARYNGIPINYLQKDMNNPYELSDEFNNYYPEKIDIIFALSLYKHIHVNLWILLDKLNFDVCYVESNNVGDKGIDSVHAKEMIAGMNSFNFNHELICVTSDRSPRCVWKLTKKGQKS